MADFLPCGDPDFGAAYRMLLQSVGNNEWVTKNMVLGAYRHNLAPLVGLFLDFEFHFKRCAVVALVASWLHTWDTLGMVPEEETIHARSRLMERESELTSHDFSDAGWEREKLEILRRTLMSDMENWLFAKAPQVKCEPLVNLSQYEWTLFSQYDADGILHAVFSVIGTSLGNNTLVGNVGPGIFVEIGTQTGHQCNTRFLRQSLGWRGLMLDDDNWNPYIHLEQAAVRSWNFHARLQHHLMPDEFDLLSIDVDGAEFVLWHSLPSKWRPRVVILEYSQRLAGDLVFTAERDTPGASADALIKLASMKGYTFVHALHEDLLFVRSDLYRRAAGCGCSGRGGPCAAGQGGRLFGAEPVKGTESPTEMQEATSLEWTTSSALLKFEHLSAEPPAFV